MVPPKGDFFAAINVSPAVVWDRSFWKTGRVAVAWLRVVVEWRAGVDSAQILKIEPVGFTGVLAMGCENRRWCKGFSSEQLNK